MGNKLACICANEAVNESPHSDNIRIATDGLTSLLKSNAFCTSFGIFGMVIDAVKINFDVKRKKQNYKTVIECGKRCSNIFYWVKKDLFGCFRERKT